MTASIKEREDKDETVKTSRREIKKLSLKNKEEQLNQLKETLEAKENETRARAERQVEKDEDGIVFD